MKKILVLLIGIIISFNLFSQSLEKNKFEMINNGFKVKYVKESRILQVDTVQYFILAREELHFGYYRMLGFKDYKYYDIIFERGSFVYIVELKNY